MRRGWAGVALTAGLALAGATAGATATAAPRVVSLNPCLDAMLVRLADRPQVAALSRLSRQPQTSTIAALARTFPVTDGGAEAVAALRPDLVVLSGYAPAPLAGALRRLRVRVETFAIPNTVGESEAQVRRMARLVGHPARGEALVAQMERALAAAAPPPGAPRVPALLFEPGGFTTGPGTLSDALMRRAGLSNQAVAYGYTRSRDVELERVVADPPAVLLAGEGRGPSRAERLLRHPALRATAGRMRRADYPARLSYCGGPVVIAAAAALARARIEATGR